MRAIAALALCAGIAACHSDKGGDVNLARAVIATQCAGCHTVPGVGAAQGRVGPNLAGIGRQQVLGGRLPNSRENMLRWIAHAQAIAPGGVMPDVPLSPREASAVADYLARLDD